MGLGFRIWGLGFRPSERGPILLSKVHTLNLMLGCSSESTEASDKLDSKHCQAFSGNGLLVSVVLAPQTVPTSFMLTSNAMVKLCCQEGSLQECVHYVHGESMCKFCKELQCTLSPDSDVLAFGSALLVGLVPSCI